MKEIQTVGIFFPPLLHLQWSLFFFFFDTLKMCKRLQEFPVPVCFVAFISARFSCPTGGVESFWAVFPPLAFTNALTPPVRSPPPTPRRQQILIVIKQQRGGDLVASTQVFDGVTAANWTVLMEGCAFTGAVAPGSCCFLRSRTRPQQNKRKGTGCRIDNRSFAGLCPGINSEFPKRNVLWTVVIFWAGENFLKNDKILLSSWKTTVQQTMLLDALVYAFRLEFQVLNMFILASRERGCHFQCPTCSVFIDKGCRTKEVSLSHLTAGDSG